MDAISYSHSAKQARRIKRIIENPDSTSGIVTVPKVIESGENITIPAGRVAVLPNVQVDGVLNIEGEVFIPSGATFSKVVETEGNQTIAGVKTFSSSPIVPTPTAGDNSTKVATTAFVKAKSEADSIGVGQTWQNVTASRSLGVTYTNTTGKPIQVIITNKAGTTNVDFNIIIDGVARALFVIGPQSTSNQFGLLTAIIPNNSTYSTVSYNSSVLHSWQELR